ncbi:Protein p13 MTCP-1 [Camelus dromedarius]|uniref:Protein p13 MTCP-1 n=1 Tax=Camelus dromedarius TaxID=9838 RepID=A0A5N4C1U2_CAMDR|nr:Protein p13 MTCP-1 [Camelus dromedarius]
MAGEDVGAPPDHLWVHQEGIYRDEYQRTWVAVVEEETSFLRARVQQVQVPLANNYMESKCQAVIQELRKCCARYPKGRSPVCSGFEKEEEEKLTLKSTSK